MKRLLRALPVLCLVFGAAAQSATAQQAQAASGVYTDRAGGRHAWQVAANHTLVWEGRPYVPVGGRFVPRWLSEGATEENWARDVEELATVKGRGVLDLLIDPEVSAARVPAEAWQRLVDHLEAEGFRYGIAFGAGVDIPLTGVVVSPSAYRIPGLQTGSEAAWDTPDADMGWYIVADGRDGTQVLGEGRVYARAGRIAVTVTSRSAEGAVALLYPRKRLLPTAEGSLPDIWSGFDAYRDRLLQTLGQVRFGPGLRFFLDPLGPAVGLPGEADYVIPESPAWRLEWEAFLSRKYPTPAALATAWALVDRDLPDFRTAAALVPLWRRNKGVPYMLDTATGKRLQVAGSESRFWSDFRDFRDQSLVYFFSATADILKREVAGVPVVYTHTLQHRIFEWQPGAAGPDGLGVRAHGSGLRLAQSALAAAYSQVTDSPKGLWFLATDVRPSETAGQVGYSSREALLADLSTLMGAGARGVFVNSLRPGAQSRAAATALADAPEQLEWLRDAGARLTSGSAAGASGPRTLPFPSAAAGYVQAGPIRGSSVYWVPSLAAGRALDFGSSYAGYIITMPEGETLVLWSLTGPRDTRLQVADPKKVVVLNPEGASLEVKADPKNRIARLTVPDTPILIRNFGQEAFPLEALEDSLRQLRTLVEQAQAAKIPAQDVRYMLDTAETRYRRKDVNGAFALAQQALAGIVELMQPYSWREVEHASVHTFTEAVPAAGASAGMYLALNNSGAPPRDGYSFQIKFRVPAEDTYTVWLACSPPSDETSPFAWVVDTGESRSSAEARVGGGAYLGDRFAWLELGKVSLKAGEHTFTLRVTERSRAGGLYAFAADVLLVTRGPFTPRGTARPPAVPTRP